MDVRRVSRSHIRIHVVLGLKVYGLGLRVYSLAC